MNLIVLDEAFGFIHRALLDTMDQPVFLKQEAAETVQKVRQEQEQKQRAANSLSNLSNMEIQMRMDELYQKSNDLYDNRKTGKGPARCQGRSQTLF